MFTKLKNNILLTLGLATIIYLLILFLSDFNLILKTLSEFNALIFLQVLFLIFLSLVLKFFRWHFYLRYLKIPLILKDSILIYCSGLIMSISPGKLGELFKSYMIKEKINIEISKTAPIILAERIIEFLALLIMAFVGVLAFEYGIEYLVIPILLTFIVLFIFTNKNHLAKIVFFITKISFLKKYQKGLFNLISNTNLLFKPVPFLSMLVLSIVAWIFEFFGFYIIITSFISNVSIMWTTFVYSFSIIVGAISMLPGGIGATEGSLVYLLGQQDILNNQAISATIIIRLATLWFSVLIGVISLFLFFRKEKHIFNKIKNISDDNSV